MRRLGWTLFSILALAAPALAGPGVWTPAGGPEPPAAHLLADPIHPQTLYAMLARRGGGGWSLWKSTDGGDTWRSIQAGIGGPVSLLALDPLDTDRLYAWAPAAYPTSPAPRLWASEDGGATWTVRYTPAAVDDVGFFWQIVASPLREGVLYGWKDGNSSFNAQVYRSLDGGASWQRRGEVGSQRSSIEALSHHPTRDRLEFSDNQGFYVSADGGLTWTVQGTFRGQGFREVTRSNAAPDRLYALPAGPTPCLVRSDNSGASWSRTGSPALPANVYCSDVAVDPRDPDLVRVVAVGAVGSRPVVVLSTSRDGGATWSKPQPIPSTETLATGAGPSVLFADSRRDSATPGPYRSTDDGATWSPAWEGMASGDLRAGLAALAGPRRQPILVAAAATLDTTSEGLLVRSADGGASWRTVSSPADTFRDLVADANGRTVYALRQNEGQFLVQSTDRGLTWTPLPRPPVFLDLLYPDPYRPGRLFASAFEDGPSRITVWRTLDGGRSWARRSAGLPVVCSHIASVDYCPGIAAQASDPRDPDRVLIAFGGEGFFSLTIKVYVSTNGGTRWHLAAASPEGSATSTTALAADTGTAEAFLAGTGAGRIFRSTDGGEHWTAHGAGLPVEAPVRQLLRDPQSGAWYAVTDGRGIFRSTDGGLTWSDITAGLPELERPLVVLDPLQADHLFAAVAGEGVWSWMP